MITGAHSIIYTKNPDADRAFLKDVLRLTHVDVGHGWLIFGLPPSEIAFHPSETNDKHEFYFICENVNAFRAAMAERGIACSPVQTQRWGLITQVTLPGGGAIGVYEPLHPRPPIPSVKSAKKPKSRTKKAGIKKSGKTKIAKKKPRAVPKRRAK